MFNPAGLYWYKAVVASKYDGDTWRLNIDLGFDSWLMNQSVRLYGIDTPEIRGEERPQGLIALDVVNKWCPNGTHLLLQSIEDKTGKYGRWLGMIWPEDWDQSVNGRLLEQGFATEYMG